MSAADREVDRQVIPRWRDMLATVRHRELGASGLVSFPPVVAQRDAESLSARVSEFRTHGSLSFAADLLSASIVVGVTPETRNAAELVSASPSTPAMLAQTANWILRQADGIGDEPAPSTNSEHQRHRDIAELRHGLRSNPRNAVRWVELARHYVNEGHRNKAETAIRIAVNIAPYDRYILRCAVRLWVHFGAPKEAVRTLRHARAAVLADPWLLATEIAASAETATTSRNVKRGREMVDGAFHTPIALSELTSALATLEMRAGAERRARKLFRSALVDPNENSVAQAEWASSRLSGLDLGDKQIELSAEARARRYADEDDTDAALSATWEWLIDQPFSSAPAAFGSYRASMTGRFEEAIRFARAGLRPNPRNALLLNNLAFSQANAGELDTAEKTLGEVESDSEGAMRPTLTATRGFVAFRSGQADAGRMLYREAIGIMSVGTQRLRAELMLASEEVRIGSPEGAQVAAVLDAIAHASDPQLKMWARHQTSAARSPHLQRP
jgi:tetratricopeptide (TPR) repeat protein